MKHIAIILVAIIIVCAVVIATFVPLLPLGMIVDTNTKGYEWKGDDPVVGLTTPELTDETDLVTSWKSGANSVKLVMEGNVRFPNCNGWAFREFMPSRYYYNIYIDEGNGWNLIFSRTNYDRDLIHVTHPTTGHPGDAQKFSGRDYQNWPAPRYDEDGKKIADNSDITFLGGCGGFTTLQGGAYAIELKGPHVGALKVEFWVEVFNPGLWEVGDTTPHLFVKDEVRLLDGTGSVEVLPRGSMDPGASGYYVFEEGDTVTIEMDTGFSGKRQGGESSSLGWELRVYDPLGDRVKEWDIPDDKRGYEKTFTIPEGSYNAQGSNQWKVELYNSLFKQDEKDFFTVDCIDKIPETPVITFDKIAYDMGDWCVVTATAEGNPSTGLGIYEFRIKVYYQGTIDYLHDEYIQASSMGDNKYSASATFTMTRGDRYVVAESQAFDGPHNQGGRPSFMGKNMVWVRDKNPESDTYVLDVYVRAENKTLVEDATVDCGTKTAKTNIDGKATFISLPKDTYEVTAKKAGLGSGKETVVLDGDKSITIYLTSDGNGEGIPYLNIIAAILVACIFIVIGVLAPGGLPIKILIMVLGVVLAVVLYLFLGGMI